MRGRDYVSGVSKLETFERETLEIEVLEELVIVELDTETLQLFEGFGTQGEIVELIVVEGALVVATPLREVKQK